MKTWAFETLVGKCSATRYSVAAPPPGARHGLGGPMHPRHPLRWQRERGATGAFGSCGTPATHSELRNEPRQGCSYTVERDRVLGVASAPLRAAFRGLWWPPTKVRSGPGKPNQKRPVRELFAGAFRNKNSM